MHAFPFSKDTDGYLVDDPDFPAIEIPAFTDVEVADRFGDAAIVSAERHYVILEGLADDFAFSPKAARKLAKALKRAARFVEESA